MFTSGFRETNLRLTLGIWKIFGVQATEPEREERLFVKRQKSGSKGQEEEGGILGECS